MFTTASEQPEPYDTTVDVIGEFENWMLDLVALQGVNVPVGYRTWHKSPIDLWVVARGFSWEWADNHPAIREYRRLIDAVHESITTPIAAYEALAVLGLLKTLIRYRMA